MTQLVRKLVPKPATDSFFSTSYRQLSTHQGYTLQGTNKRPPQTRNSPSMSRDNIVIQHPVSDDNIFGVQVSQKGSLKWKRLWLFWDRRAGGSRRRGAAGRREGELITWSLINAPVLYFPWRPRVFLPIPLHHVIGGFRRHCPIMWDRLGCASDMRAKTISLPARVNARKVPLPRHLRKSELLEKEYDTV